MSSPVTIHLALHGLDGVTERLRSEIVVIVRHEFEPLVKEAGMSLILSTGRGTGDLNMDFDTTEPADPPCHLTFLGEDAGHSVWVEAHRNLRVCSAKDPKTGKRDLRRFLTTDPLLGRALANTALHELGHFIADLDHTAEIGNYMFTWGIPPAQRTLQSQRHAWAGQKTFTADQRAKIVRQLKAREWLGDMSVESQ
jgi:hypothetical protein